MDSLNNPTPSLVAEAAAAAATKTPQMPPQVQPPAQPQVTVNSHPSLADPIPLATVSSSHDNSSLSGSEVGGTATTTSVERVNPFEQQIIINNNSSNSSLGARPALEQIGSQQSASPERQLPQQQQQQHDLHSAPSSPQPHIPTRAVMPTMSPSSTAGGGNSIPRPPLEVSATHLPHLPTPEEDDYTHSSSAVNSTEPASSYTPSTGEVSLQHPQQRQQQQHGQQQPPPGVAQTFVRFLETTRKRMSYTNYSRNSSDDDLIEDLDGMIISGYLQKLGRNGKWQNRWFESDGECLSYYKNENRTKLLATLDLEKVGAIGLDPSDTEECSFTIQVLGRLYHLRAENKVSCTDWVITLNRIKEARMHQGNVKLLPSHHQQQQMQMQQQQQQQQQQQSNEPVDLLDQTENLVAPRVVVVSNRHRTRAMAETQDFDHILRDNGDATNQLAMMGASSKRLSTIGTVVLARWNKRRSSISRLRSKLAKWARSLRKLSCITDDGIALDNHVHPPGHDDDRKKKKHLGWIGKEATSAAPDAAVARHAEDDSDVDKRILRQPPPRKMSSASEDIRVLS